MKYNFHLSIQLVLLVKSVLEVKLSESNEDSKKLVSILELPGDILIIPQACLGGRLKGKTVQYHCNINKEKGLLYYQKFIESCRKKISLNQSWMSSCKLENGTFGIKQVYSTETDGPFLHIIEF